MAFSSTLPFSTKLTNSVPVFCLSALSKSHFTQNLHAAEDGQLAYLFLYTVFFLNVYVLFDSNRHGHLLGAQDKEGLLQRYRRQAAPRRAA